MGLTDGVGLVLDQSALGSEVLSFLDAVLPPSKPCGKAGEVEHMVSVLATTPASKAALETTQVQILNFQSSMHHQVKPLNSFTVNSPLVMIQDSLHEPEPQLVDCTYHYISWPLAIAHPVVASPTPWNPSPAPAMLEPLYFGWLLPSKWRRSALCLPVHVDFHSQEVFCV